MARIVHRNDLAAPSTHCVDPRAGTQLRAAPIGNIVTLTIAMSEPDRTGDLGDAWAEAANLAFHRGLAVRPSPALVGVEGIGDHLELRLLRQAFGAALELIGNVARAGRAWHLVQPSPPTRLIYRPTKWHSVSSVPQFSLPRGESMTGRDMLRVVVALIFVLFTPHAAFAEKRVALVVGNSAYKHAAELANPKNDAVDMVAALKRLDFQVVEGFDLSKPAFDRKVREFASALSNADAGLFFYAGHGLQVAGKNYLVPIDAELTTADALEFEMVELEVVHRIMERHAPTNIVFLDACRNNPFTRNLARAMGTRSSAIGQGLAAAESGIGTLISFSTQPGNVALDGAGRNSPFAGALTKRILSAGDDLSAILIDVRNDVRKQTGGKQVPWEHSALTGRFYFKHPVKTTAPPETSLPPTLNVPKPPPDEPVMVGQSAWVRLCEHTKSGDAGSQERSVRICLTHHERLDGNTGMVMVSAAIRQIDGQDKQQLMVMVPLGMLLSPGLKATIYPQDLWRKSQNKEAVDEKSLFQLRLKFTLCHPAGCTAEVEANPDIIEWMRRGGGMMVYAINAEGKPVGFPVPFNGLASSYAGPPTDNKAYGDARKKLMAQIAERQKELKAKAERSGK